VNTPIRFSFDHKPVRIVEENGEFWFCLSDVGKALGMTNHKMFLRSKSCDQGGVKNIYTPTESGDQDITFINEPNLYAIILRSTKEEAVTFRNWVTHEVLPRIRKEGKYELSTSPSTSIQSGDPIIQTMTAMITLRQTQLDHEQRLTALEDARAASTEAALALPAPEVRELTVREQCREGVRRLVELTSMDFQKCWREAYAKYNIHMGTNVTFCAENRKMDKLDYIEKHGNIDVLLGVIGKLVEKASLTLVAGGS
jgi:prophage antirepressor-like protein